MYQLVIKNGRVIDGTGSPERVLDIAIDGGKIVNMAPNITVAAHKVIEADGKIVAPGFIDVQNHSDVHWQLFENPLLESLTSQGYTTIAVGNCGASLAPLSNKNSLLPIQKWHDVSSENGNWGSLAELEQAINAKGAGLNIVTFLGYETLRRAFTGDEMRSLTGVERKAIIMQIIQGMKDGACGVSFGLAYAHEYTTPEHEIKEVMEAVSAAGGLISVHLRSEGSHVFEAVEEVVHLAEQTGARVKISHLKIRGRRNWNQLEHVLRYIENARHKNFEIYFDVYPYDTTWQVLYNYLPNWITEHGRAHMLSELKNPIQRRKALDYIRDYNLGIGDFILASSTNNLSGAGKKISELAHSLNISSEETLLYLLEHGGSEVMVFDKNLHWEGVEELMFHPLSLIGSDGGGFSLDTTHKTKLVHPRCFGTAPAFIHTAIESKKITLPEMIHKLTQRPAMLLGLQKNRGTLEINKEADIVIFDEDTIEARATIQNPFQQAAGIEYVLVHGTEVVQNGIVQPVLPGRFLS